VLRINDEAPNFTAETSKGTLDFHEWIGDGWAILFSHPKDFTPVCTTAGFRETQLQDYRA
jgi:alkyl hydroperoxide reductase subunit AhpC